ncbi:hypothetical protein F6W99_03903 [Mycobacterium tuberculosis]|nr:hypothetical protein F6W99_03903 [Mycobacterium tuberculosis]
MDAITQVPVPANEPVHDYAPKSPERTRLRTELASLADHPIDLPHVIGGRHRMGDGERIDVVQPHRHAARLGTLTNATHADAAAAVEAAMSAKSDWAALPFDERAAVFLRAADLLAGPWREKIAAATMLGQSKSVYQAEIDAVCELIDFWRFNVAFARQILEQQPISGPGGMEPDRLPPAGRFRLRDHAVQLHLDRRQSADRPGSDGQHRDLEAVDHPDAGGLSDHATARGRRVAARGDQPGHWRRIRGFRCGTGRSTAGRHPLHRVDGYLRPPMAVGGYQYRPLP